VTWLFSAIALLAGSAVADDLPADLDAILRDNLDKIVFKSYTVAKVTKDEYGTWICGRMVARVFPGREADYIEAPFVAQLFPPSPDRLLASPRSWVTVAWSEVNRETYHEHCP
jgi:hypothetical protein